MLHQTQVISVKLDTAGDISKASEGPQITLSHYWALRYPDSTLALKISELMRGICSNSCFIFGGSLLLQLSKNRFCVLFSRISFLHERGLTRIHVFLLFSAQTLSKSVTPEY